MEECAAMNDSSRRLQRSGRPRPAAAAAALRLPPFVPLDHALARQRRLRPHQQRRLLRAFRHRVNASDRGRRARHRAGAGDRLVVETHCNYFAPLAFPQALEAGIRVGRVGCSSVRYEIGIFAAGAAETAAAATSSTSTSTVRQRRPVALPDR
jgi:hypothetical protein